MTQLTLKPLLWRSFKVALVVGTLLVAINYGHRIIQSELTPADFWRIALTYCVPFCVSLYGAITALKNHRSESS